MTDQYHLINWNNLPDSSKITMLRDRTDQLTTQLHQLIMQVRQLTGQVQQLASGFATMQAGLNEMQARFDDVAPVRSSGGGGITDRASEGGLAESREAATQAFAKSWHRE